MMRIKMTSLWFITTTLLAGAAPAFAQQAPLAGLLVNLIQSEVRLAPQTNPAFPSHEAHFIPGLDQTLAPYIFNAAIVSELATFPIGTSSGGFTYSYDASVGTFSRNTQSFGPSFAERAETSGRGKVAFGASFLHSSYDSFEGESIDDGSIKFYLTHKPGGNDAFFEGDLIEAALKMKLTRDTYVFFGNFGVTDRLDLGIVLPVVRVDLDASVDANIIRLATAGIPLLHTFPCQPAGACSVSSATFSDSGSASGLGDVLLRGKYRFVSVPGGGLAAGVDLRLPSGDSDDLLGTGATQAKLSLIASGTAGMFSPHVNVGYTFSGESDSDYFNVTDEFNYAAGLEFAPASRVTFVADVVGRSLRDAGNLAITPQTYQFRNQLGQSGSASYSQFVEQSGSRNLTLGAFGVKLNPSSSMLINFNLLVPFSDSGITANVTPVVGVDFTF